MIFEDTFAEPRVVLLAEADTAVLTLEAKSVEDHTNTTLAVLLPTSIDTVADVRSASLYVFAAVAPHVVLVSKTTVSEN
jgi:hypothetical protein